MVRYFTHYWENGTWDDEKYVVETAISEGDPDPEVDRLAHVAGNQFATWDLQEGDFVYVITVRQGRLYLLARMEVEGIYSQEEAAAMREWNLEDMWQASQHILAKEGTGTRMSFEAPPIDPMLVKQLLFNRKGPPTPRAPKFLDADAGILDQQALRGVAELTEGSAALLDSIIEERG